MSLFNPETFLNQQVTGANATKYPVIPQGEYPAISTKLDVRQMPNEKDPVHPFTVLDITWGIDDAGVKEATKLESPTCRQSVFLDLEDTPEGPKISTDETKNVQLGRIREALGLNDPNTPFSFSQLVGQPAIVRVEHKPNPNDPDNPYSNVTKVATSG